MDWLLRIILTLGYFPMFSECSTCPSIKSCDPFANSLLYPTSFTIFRGYEGQVFTSGQTILVVAIFPDNVCNLPQPNFTNPNCVPMLSLSVYSTDGSNCLSVPAAPSAQYIERLHAVSFKSLSNLDKLYLNYNFWVFPIHVLKGQYTSQLKVRGLLIPTACNTRAATFVNLDLIPKINNLLTPNVTIDTNPARIINVYTGKLPGTYTAGDIINIIVEFSKDVMFTELPSKFSEVYQKANASYVLPFGLPFLELNSLSYATLQGYEAGTINRRKLSFLYTVSTGEFTPDGGQLEVAAGATIQLNGGNIVAADTGAVADLTSMPLPGTHGDSWTLKSSKSVSHKPT